MNLRARISGLESNGFRQLSFCARKITFRGQQVPQRVADAAAPFLGRPADKPTLSALAAALSAAYARSNIAFYTIAIGAQEAEQFE